MKTATQILNKWISNGDLNSEPEIVKAMEEYAQQFAQPIADVPNNDFAYSVYGVCTGSLTDCKKIETIKKYAAEKLSEKVNTEANDERKFSLREMLEAVRYFNDSMNIGRQMGEEQYFKEKFNINYE